MQYEKLEINNIYEVVFNLVKESKEKLTINEFRKWIAENQADIQTHYGNLLNFDKND